jgi:hypothetical protein
MMRTNRITFDDSRPVAEIWLLQIGGSGGLVRRLAATNGNYIC